MHGDPTTNRARLMPVTYISDEPTVIYTHANSVTDVGHYVEIRSPGVPNARISWEVADLIHSRVRLRRTKPSLIPSSERSDRVIGFSAVAFVIAVLLSALFYFWRYGA